MRRAIAGRVCYALGLMLRWGRMPKVALVPFRLAVQLNSADIAARYEHAATMWQCGSHGDALNEYRWLVREQPQNLTFHYELAWVLEGMGSHAEAVAILEHALAIESRGEIYVALVRCYRALGRVKDSEAALQRAFRHAPNHPDVQLEQVQAAAEQRQWSRVIDPGLDLMRSEPSAEVAYFTGVGLAQGARLAEAEAVLRKGIELGPESSDLAAQLVIVLADQGELAEAHRALDQAFERHADDRYGLILTRQRPTSPPAMHTWNWSKRMRPWTPSARLSSLHQAYCTPKQVWRHRSACSNVTMNRGRRFARCSAQIPTTSSPHPLNN